MNEDTIQLQIQLSEISQGALEKLIDKLKNQASLAEIVLSDLKEKSSDNIVEILKHEMFIIELKKIINSLLDKLLEESKSHLLLLKALNTVLEKDQQQNIH